MDNRFGVKDFILLGMMGVLLIVMLLGIVQYDRQWEQLKAVKDASVTQEGSISQIQRQSVETQKAVGDLPSRLTVLSELQREVVSLQAQIAELSANQSQSLGGLAANLEALNNAIIEGQGDATALREQLAALQEASRQQQEAVAQQLAEFQNRVESINNRIAQEQAQLAAENTTSPFYRIQDLPDRSDYATGDFYIDCFGATVKNLTPLVAGDVYADRIDDHVLETLCRRDPNTFEWMPLLATDWSISDDGLVFTFNLRPNATFSDGHPLTARDVVFTYDWIMNPKIAAPRARAYYEKVQSVEAVGDYQVVFTLNEPYFNSMSLCAEMEILAEHYYSQFTEDEYNETPGLLFGSGPFKLQGDPKDWRAGTGAITLVRNENYWGQLPALDRVIWKMIDDDTARLAEFRNGEIDRFSVVPSMYRTLSRDEGLLERARLYEYEYVSSGYLYIGWNQSKDGQPTPFADPKVRLAMTLLVDRDRICERIYDNLATPATGPFHPLGFQADPDLEPHPYDPDRAAELLEEAGFDDRNGDGVLEDAEGRPFTFKFIYSTGSTEAQQMALQIKDAMARVGVNMELDRLDWPIMQQKLDDRDFDAIMLGWGGSVESDVYQMFHSDQIADGGDNYISYNSPRADAAIERARTTVDPALTPTAWHDVHRILHEEQPYTFLTNRKAVALIDNRVENIEPTGIGLNYAWEYYVPGPVQRHTGQ